jgi:membrane associated rhomboid family serine protease
MQDISDIFVGSAGLDSGQKLLALIAGIGAFAAVFGAAIGLLLIGLIKKDNGSH